MPASNLGFPYDPELFLMAWRNVADPTRTALIDSAAVQQNSQIRSLIANGSDLYTIPFYDIIGGDPDNYDGTDDITVTDPKGLSQTGVVYGRGHAWKAQDFIVDFNSGANPMQQIASQVDRYWQKQRQKTLLSILKGIFSTTDNTGGYKAAWDLHTTSLVVTTDAAPTEDNMMGEATAAEAIQKAVGDNSSIFSMGIMHSKVALGLAKKQLLEFRKYTDPSGIERTLNIADYNGMTVLVDDGVPVADNATESGSAMGYTSYFFGVGAIQMAPAPVLNPVEIGRERLKAGGYDYMVTRIRETQHPNGFSFKAPASSYTKSPTNAQLETAANWLIAVNPKTIPIVRVVTNG